MALAPMSDVTDAAFRRIVAKYGKPDVMFTEFVSADGLFLADDKGRKKLLRAFLYTENERPIVAQFFSSKPEMIKKAASLAAEMGFDGININMGCPDRSVERQGAGAALMKNPPLAREIILAAIEGAKCGKKKIPVSVKTRIGYGKDELKTWLPVLLKTGLSAVTIHARTRKELSKVPARWETIKEAVEIRNGMGVETLILGNGDATDLPDAFRRVRESGADGVVIGRAIFGNPWLFADLPELRKRFKKDSKIESSEKEKVSIKKKLEVMLEHSRLFEKMMVGSKNFPVMKKHIKAYVSGWDGAKGLRTTLMKAENLSQVEREVKKRLAGRI